MDPLYHEAYAETRESFYWSLKEVYGAAKTIPVVGAELVKSGLELIVLGTHLAALSLEYGLLSVSKKNA